MQHVHAIPAVCHAHSVSQTATGRLTAQQHSLILFPIKEAEGTAGTPCDCHLKPPWRRGHREHPGAQTTTLFPPAHDGCWQQQLVGPLQLQPPTPLQSITLDLASALQQARGLTHANAVGPANVTADQADQSCLMHQDRVKRLKQH